MKKPTAKRVIVLLIIVFAVIFEVFDIFIFSPAWWRSDPPAAEELSVL